MPRGRLVEFGQLDPTERKVVHLHIAGASNATIAYLASTNAENIRNILARPRVKDYLLKMTALTCDEIAPQVESLNERIENASERAFEVEIQAMERLEKVWDEEAPTKLHVQAQVSSAQLAQDILDRAGKRAPTKIQQQIRHEVAPATIEHLGRIMNEAAIVDITPTRGKDEEDLDIASNDR